MINYWILCGSFSFIIEKMDSLGQQLEKKKKKTLEYKHVAKYVKAT